MSCRSSHFPIFIAVGLCGEPHTCAGAPQLPALRIALGADGGHRGGVGIGEGGAARAMLGLLSLLGAGPPLSGLSHLRLIGDSIYIYMNYKISYELLTEQVG